MTSVAHEPACSFCGLPLPRSAFGDATEQTQAPAYCCFGCRFAAAAAQASGELGRLNWTLARLGLAIFLSMNVMVFTMALWTQEADPGASDGFAASLNAVFRYLCMLFALPVLFLLGGPLLEATAEALRQRRLPLELLLLVGVMAAYGYSIVSVLRDRGHIYFEVGCMVLVLVTLGRWLEAQGRFQAGNVMQSLVKLLPETVLRITPQGVVSCARQEIRIGDRILVRPGERVPCDGVVVEHPALMDEQFLTGESTPVRKEVGVPVFGGTLNLEGELLLQATAESEAGVLGRFMELVRQALQSQGHYQRLADRVTAVFLPAVGLIALAALGWHGYRSGWDAGLLSALAVILIACPCALGIATPLALAVALGEAAKAGILIRAGEALELLAAARAVCFDKTGTLTTGNPEVHEVICDDPEAGEAGGNCPLLGQARCLAVRLAMTSTHPYSQAIVRWAEQDMFMSTAPDAVPLQGPVRTYAGLGLVASCRNGCTLALGSPRLMQMLGCEPSPRLREAVHRAESQGLAVTCLAWDQAVRTCFMLREEIRGEAKAVLARLRAEGLDVAVLTGDHKARAEQMEELLGVPVRSGLLPEDKVRIIEETQRRLGRTVMVGDGLNDAPALARSDVGIALACGTDLAREAATICLVGDDLRQIPWLFHLAKATVHTIRVNLFWAFAYNTLGIAAAVSGLLNPIIAALAMVLSSAFVIGNSLRLRRHVWRGETACLAGS